MKIIGIAVLFFFGVLNSLFAQDELSLGLDYGAHYLPISDISNKGRGNYYSANLRYFWKSNMGADAGLGFTTDLKGANLMTSMPLHLCIRTNSGEGRAFKGGGYDPLSIIMALLVVLVPSHGEYCLGTTLSYLNKSSNSAGSELLIKQAFVCTLDAGMKLNFKVADQLSIGPQLMFGFVTTNNYEKNNGVKSFGGTSNYQNINIRLSLNASYYFD